MMYCFYDVHVYGGCIISFTFQIYLRNFVLLELKNEQLLNVRSVSRSLVHRLYLLASGKELKHYWSPLRDRL